MKETIKFLEKVFDSLESSFTIPDEILAHSLAKVAKCNSYVETFSKHADALHYRIKQVYEEDIKRAFEIQVRKTIRKLNIRSAELAFDVTHEPFYGKTRNLHIINVANSPNKGEFQYLTCCLINKGKQIPLMALPVKYGEHVKLTIDLLKYCQTLKFKIKFVLFDRGFYKAELLDYLESRKLRYLMLIPALKGILQEYRKNTKKFAFYDHEMKYQKDKSSWKPKIKVIVCKEILKYDWMFASNIKFDNPEDYVLLYKRRWQIETNYRVEDEAKIKSKSCNYLIRYFYFMLSCLFHLLWIVNKNCNFYVQFKRYLDIIEQEIFFNFLQISSI
jgi:hypothetical protein